MIVNALGPAGWLMGADLPIPHLPTSPRTFLTVPLTVTDAVPPSVHLEWRRNVDLLSIVYAFRPRLRYRLTLGGFTFPRKP